MKFVLYVLAFSLSFMPVAFANNNKTLEGLMSEWLSLERQKGGLQTQWNTRKEQLARRLELLDSEQQSLQEVIAQKSETRNEVDERRLALMESQGRLEQEQALLEAQIQKAAAAAQALKPRLPPPLQIQWQEKLPLLSQAETSNSEKLERLLSLFKLVEEFNDRVAMHRTAMELPGIDGAVQMLHVTQIYLGAGQGWYVSDNGDIYGYGRATKLGWQWWHGDDASTELERELDPRSLLRVRSVLENPTTASYLSLPVKVQQP